MKPDRFHREAAAEFTDALRHYAGVGLELGARYYDEVEDGDRRGARASAALPPDRSAGAAAAPAELPYALLYTDEPDRVWINAVAPLKRDPGYWRHRLPE